MGHLTNTRQAYLQCTQVLRTSSLLLFATSPAMYQYLKSYLPPDATMQMQSYEIEAGGGGGACLQTPLEDSSYYKKNLPPPHTASSLGAGLIHCFVYIVIHLYCACPHLAPYVMSQLG